MDRESKYLSESSCKNILDLGQLTSHFPYKCLPLLRGRSTPTKSRPHQATTPTFQDYEIISECVSCYSLLSPFSDFGQGVSQKYQKLKKKDSFFLQDFQLNKCSKSKDVYELAFCNFATQFTSSFDGRS